MIWLQRDGAVVARERFLVALQRFQCIAAIVQRVGIVRAQGEGAIEARQRFVIALQLCQRAAEIAMRVGEIGSDGERFAVAFDGIAMLPERRKHGAAVAVRLEEIRLQLDREIEAVERLLMLVQRVERKAEVKQDPRRRRARGHCGSDQTQRLAGLAARELEITHGMQGIGIVRHDRQDGQVETFCFDDLPLPLQRRCLRKHARQVRRLVARCGRGRHARGTFLHQLEYRL